jgi:hypothetical protein
LRCQLDRANDKDVDAEPQSGKLELDSRMRVLDDQTLLEREIKVMMIRPFCLEFFAVLYGRNAASSVLVVSIVM